MSDAGPKGLEDLLQAAHANLPDWELQEHMRHRLEERITPVVDSWECQAQKLEDLTHGLFTLAEESHVLGKDFDWLRNPSRDEEWQILLHKFYYAPGLGRAFRATGNARYLETWVSLTRSWIEQTPLDFLPADVAGRRLENWVYAYSYFAGELCATFHASFLRSMHAQAEWLLGNLHPARNHRTLELHALFLAGVALAEFAQSARWREFALHELVANLRTDFLPDGVHCEQSTDYHHLVLKNLLSARRMARRNHIAVPAEMDVLLQRALEFSVHVHRPDGRVPALSDADVHDYRALLMQGFELFGRRDMLYVATQGRQGQPPAQLSRHFPIGGYTLMRSGWGRHACRYQDERYLVLDTGPLGEGNHGHLDLLSFEAYGYGQPLIVDPGRYTYHEDPAHNWRVQFRSTSYHNTVVVDQKNQARYAPSKRKYRITGPHATCQITRLDLRDPLSLVRAKLQSHEYPAVHERSIAFVRGEYWIVVDQLTSVEQHRYDLTFHLSAHAWRNTGVSDDGRCIRVVSPHLLMLHHCDSPTETSLSEGFVSERYGEKRPAPLLRVTARANNTQFTSVLIPFARELPTVRFRWTSPTRLELDVQQGASRRTDSVEFGAVSPLTSAIKDELHA